jgi:hypothetical protein
MTINRGLWRLWVAGSIGWVAVAGVVSLPAALQTPANVEPPVSAKRAVPVPDPWVGYAPAPANWWDKYPDHPPAEPTTEHVHAARMFALELIAGPPLSLLGIALGIVWVIAGFRQEAH